MYAIDTNNIAIKLLIVLINLICITSTVIILLQFSLNIYFKDSDDFVDYVSDILNIGASSIDNI